MKNINLITLVLIFVSLAFSFLAFINAGEVNRQAQSNSLRVSLLQSEIEGDRNSIDELISIVSTFIDGNEELQSALALEKERRIELERTAEANSSILGDQITSLQLEVASQNLTPLISSWSPRVGKLECKFNIDGESKDSNATAVATVSSGELLFITNDHAVSDGDDVAYICSVLMPNGVTYDIPGNRILRSEDVDVANLRTGVFNHSLSSVNKCSITPQTGDQVVILGYPSVGSEDSVTATEGIISGFDDGHYVTSAKIERGNSGGAAIHVQNNCFIGLPTLVFVGRVESLARILPI